MHDALLLAFAVERRAVTVCRFRGVILEFAKRRELASWQDKAEGTTDAFVRWAFEQFAPERVAIEFDSDRSSRRRELEAAVAQVARERAIPVWVIPKEKLYAAYGEPPVRSRAELRRLAENLWPALRDRNLGHGGFDAAALGLYVQCQAALNEIEEEARHARAS